MDPVKHNKTQYKTVKPKKIFINFLGVRRFGDCFTQPGSSPQALPNEPKLGPPSPNSSRDNQPPNLYSIWLKPDISRTTSPRPPVFGLPVEGVTSSTSRAGFPGVVFATTETTRNPCDPAEEAGGKFTKKTPLL
ncbi:hypothetical protein ACJJTC_001739 [Scirpophaga incertulas]